jgi:hypothetical protein
MPSESTSLNQYAVLMPFIGSNRHGQPVVGDPVEIRVAWKTDVTERLGPTGDLVRFDATAVVDRDVKTFSRMWLGRLTEWLVPSPADVAREIMEVKMFSWVPDFKVGYPPIRMVMLMRWHE